MVSYFDRVNFFLFFVLVSRLAMAKDRVFHVCGLKNRFGINKANTKGDVCMASFLLHHLGRNFPLFEKLMKKWKCIVTCDHGRDNLGHAYGSLTGTCTDQYGRIKKLHDADCHRCINPHHMTLVHDLDGFAAVLQDVVAELELRVTLVTAPGEQLTAEKVLQYMCDVKGNERTHHHLLLLAACLV
eukprot:m.81038 g.81038  ORF g.81038 m.81038 type:complete len:185 (-) comp12621_c0_seq6:111-665(-)